MDEFGVLTERFGLKPQGKSAPMASTKRSSPKTTSVSPQNGGSRSPQHSPFQFDYGVFATANNKTPTTSGDFSDGIDQIFAAGIPKSNSIQNDPIFGGFSQSVSPSSQVYVDDIFGGVNEKTVGVDDLLGKIGGLHATNGKSSMQQKSPDFDDLMAGFAGSTISNNGKASIETKNAQKPTAASHNDPFLVFETSSSTASSESFLDSLEQMSKNSSKSPSGSSSPSPLLRPPPKSGSAISNSRMSSIDELENFAMGQVQSNATRKANTNTGEIKQNSAAKTNKDKGAPATRVNQLNGADDLESFFSAGFRSNSVPKSRTATMDHMFDRQVNNNGKHEGSQSVPSGSQANAKKSSPATSFDDLSLMFGASPSSEFEEVEGETEERRRARLGRHQRTQERALKAVADMNQRDLQSKMEQEERRRIADSVDIQIKRWAAGKEGNMRALLSSLQNVLSPDYGWQPVSLTDMITSASVKKVYRKATLCLHPDKVQQKGANLEQKYTAEKVFDILKEAWTKFNAEELS
ncbi:auxilin-related protein 2-like [Trifolium pratense]|uniref:Auxilin-related protein 2-like n=1 Tax=Trifolium pratense TaxID=57577 RepID=A0A2K3P578_TRIPR|nr:auxilin-related protein 2-like [Trifolium pratense]